MPRPRSSSAGERKRQSVPSLPLEIVRLIESHLDLASTVSLALTCRSLKWLIGPAPFRELSTDRTARLRVLSTFSAQYPDHYLCSEHSVWHPRFDEDSFRYRFGLCEGTAVHLSPLIKINSLQAADAKRFHTYGPAFGAPLRLDTGKLSTWPLWGSTTAYKVVQGSLLFKTTLDRRSIARSVSPYTGLRYLEPEFDLNQLGAFCAHSDSALDGFVYAACVALKRRIGKGLASLRFRSDARRCPECATECAVELTWQRRLAHPWHCTVTRWTDLGPCEHADSPLWRAAADFGSGPWHRTRKVSLADLENAVPVRVRYEGHDPVPPRGDKDDTGMFDDAYEWLPKAKTWPAKRQHDAEAGRDTRRTSTRCNGAVQTR